jgi:hypothetical protein
MFVDNQKVFFAKSTTTSFEESPFLWSINHSPVSAVKGYHEIVALSSIEIKNEEHDIKTRQ